MMAIEGFKGNLTGSARGSGTQSYVTEQLLSVKVLPLGPPTCSFVPWCPKCREGRGRREVSFASSPLRHSSGHKGIRKPGQKILYRCFF